MSSAWSQQASSSNAYDPNAFYVKATDDKGHSRRIVVTVPPYLYSEIQAFVHSDDFPEYQSPQDVLRDGGVHILHRRKDEQADPGFREYVIAASSMLEWQRKILKAAQEMELWNEEVALLDKTMGLFAKEGAWNRMVQYLEDGVAHAYNMDEPYQSKWLGKIAEWQKVVNENKPPETLLETGEPE